MLIRLVVLTVVFPLVAIAAPRVIPPEDVLNWQRFDAPLVSNDGQWFACRSRAEVGKVTILVHSTASDREYRLAAGNVPHPAVSSLPGRGQFSADGAWFACLSLPKTESTSKDKPVASWLQLLNLKTGEIREFTRVKDFAFSGETSRYLLIHSAPPEGSKETVSDLTLLELATGRETTIARISEFSCDKPGRRIAWTSENAEEKRGSIVLFDCGSGRLTPLDSGTYRYTKLTWTETGDAFAALRCTRVEKDQTPRVALVYIRDFQATSAAEIYDPVDDKTFLAGCLISEHRAPQWTGNRGALLFGLRPLPNERAAGEAKSAEKKEPAEGRPKLILWHWRDSRLQSAQIKTEEADKQFSRYAAFSPASHRVVPLTKDSMREVLLPKQGHWAVALDPTPYELTASLTGAEAADLYRVDLETGKTERFAEKVAYHYDLSPDGRWFLFFQRGHYSACEVESGRIVTLTAKAPVSFLDGEDDNAREEVPVKPVGWAADSQSVLLSDGWDLWRIGVGEPGAANLTQRGRRDRIRFERLKLDDEEKGIDFTLPIYCRILAEETKQGGLARLDPGATEPKILVLDDACYATVLRGRHAANLVYTREDYATFPDFFSVEADLKNARRLTEGQAQLAPYAWSSGVRLLKYKSDGPTKTNDLQAALFLPANYQPGARYPTLVLVYEKLAFNLHRFNPPGYGDFSRSYFTSHGYAVLYPDISYALDNPGPSATRCVLPAVRAAIDSGVADSNRFGLFGQSWGGYECNFLITQTNAFRAAVSSEGLTDLVSMYGILFKRTGIGNMPIFEGDQPRLSAGPLAIPEVYARNSPLVHAGAVQTPLLMVHNDQDDAVDFTQGLEFYSVLRRLSKPVVLLEYQGESHHLIQPENRLDSLRRQTEFFDHHLKDAPAPRWWAEGIRRIDLPDELDGRSEATSSSAATPAGKGS